MDKVLFVIGLIFIASAFMIFYASVKFEKELIREEIIPRYEKSKIIFSNITYIIRAKYKLINKYKIAMNDYVYITIPRNTTYQYSILVSMNPKYVKLQKDNDGNVNILDVTYLIAYLYQSGPAPIIWVPGRICIGKTSRSNTAKFGSFV